jgi:hypothetical protein
VQLAFGRKLEALDATEGALGLRCTRPSRVLRGMVLRLAGESLDTIQLGVGRPSGARQPARSVSRAADRAVTETDSGVPASDLESVRGPRCSVKALRSPRRTKESPHPRR